MSIKKHNDTVPAVVVHTVVVLGTAAVAVVAFIPFVVVVAPTEIFPVDAYAAAVTAVFVHANVVPVLAYYSVVAYAFVVPFVAVVASLALPPLQFLFLFFYFQLMFLLLFLMQEA